ncbi:MULTISPECIES: hypothetical protein [unclassified Luteimonas]
MRHLNISSRRCIAVALAAAIVAAGCSESPVNPQDVAPDGIPAASEAVDWSQPSPQAVLGESPARRVDGPDAYLCAGAHARCSDDVFMAVDAREADWLIRNGYPSPAERQRLQELTIEQLESEAPGNEAAVLELAMRHLDAGDPYHAIGMTYPLARAGNLFAYHVLADIHAAKGPRQDMLESGAYLRLAYILGDHRAGDVLAERLSRFGPVEHRMVDRRAASLYQTFAEGRTPDPRPFGGSD